VTNPPDATVTLRIPVRFYADHRARDCGETGCVVIDGRQYVTVTLDSLAYEDLLTDAVYYSNPDVARDMGIPGLAASARATVRRLMAVTPPECESTSERTDDRARREYTIGARVHQPDNPRCPHGTVCGIPAEGFIDVRFDSGRVSRRLPTRYWKPING
jgi:hypothetical protein